jgi:hypothetical protein
MGLGMAGYFRLQQVRFGPRTLGNLKLVLLYSIIIIIIIIAAVHSSQLELERASAHLMHTIPPPSTGAKGNK